MSSKLKMTYSIELNEDTPEKTLKEILLETIKLKPGFKYAVESILVTVITEEA